MAKYLGGCHCEAVRFEVEADLAAVTDCNCSICTKKGALHYRVTSFSLLTGDGDLTVYQFGGKIAKHYFCRHCGIHVMTNPRAAPDKVAVNVRCLDDFEAFKDRLVVKSFDGRNWEAAVSGFKFD